MLNYACNLQKKNINLSGSLNYEFSTIKTCSGSTWYINWFFICFDIQNNSAAKIGTSDKNLHLFQTNIVKNSL